jgi:peptidoglycan/xylan/chitin deacetylase (PgdA/CDA1 family)
MTRTIKFIISAIVWAGTSLWRILQRIAGQKQHGTCVVLYYHAVTAEDRAKFARQMDCLKRLAKPISADANSQLESGVHHVIVTFDDGFQSTAENAIPELVRRRIPSTIFVPTGYLGRHPQWTDAPDYGDRTQTVMTAEQLQRISSALTSVESHTVTHPKLPLLTAEDAKRELSKSKCELEALLRRKITLLSFPYGAYNPALVEWSRQAGYERVFTVWPSSARSGPLGYVTGRVPISPRDWQLEFRLKVLGAYSWLPLAFELKRYARRIGVEAGRRLFVEASKIRRTRVRV